MVVRDGEVVGEGWYEYDLVRHAEAAALEQAGARARGATLYVTLEPCSHHGRTPPCADAVVAAGIARAVVGALDPNPLVDGRGLARLREAGVEVELLDSLEARRQNEAWRVWKALGRPFVTYKAAVSLDGRVTVPGRRWVSGESRSGSCTSCAPPRTRSPSAWGRSAPTLRASTPAASSAARQPRRLAFGRGPLPEGSGLELRSGPLDEELRALAADGVQSLLLEGGPTLATAFLEAEPRRQAAALRRAGARRRRATLPRRPRRRRSTCSTRRVAQVGEDVLLEAYLREP